MPLTFDPIIPHLDYVLKRGTKKDIVGMFEKLPVACSLITVMKMMGNPRRKYIKMWLVGLPGAVSFHFYIFKFFSIFKIFTFIIKKKYFKNCFFLLLEA